MPFVYIDLFQSGKDDDKDFEVSLHYSHSYSPFLIVEKVISLTPIEVKHYSVFQILKDGNVYPRAVPVVVRCKGNIIHNLIVQAMEKVGDLQT